MCSLITHLHYHEPANFAFVYILRNGALRKMINDNIGDNGKIQWNILIIMNFLYARLRLHEKQKNREYNNSCVVLEPLPGTIKEVIYILLMDSYLMNLLSIKRSGFNILIFRL